MLWLSACTTGAAPGSDGGAAVEAADNSTNTPTEGIPLGGPTQVDLAGIAASSAARLDNKSSVAAVGLRVAVHARPEAKGAPIGWLRAGAIVATRGSALRGDGTCAGNWQAIEPAGFVCVGTEVTRDLHHPVVRATTRRPDLTTSLPYMYGTVTRGGPLYSRLPTADDLARFEPNLQRHLSKWEKDEVSGAAYGADLWHKWKSTPAPDPLVALAAKQTDADIPWFFANGGSAPVPPDRPKDLSPAPKAGDLTQKNGVAFIDSFLFEGRRYGLTMDLRLAPADRFRPIRGSDFHGWRIGSDVQFPFAVVRRPGGSRFKLHKGTLTKGEPLEWRTTVPITGKVNFFGGVMHYETTEGDWISDRFAGAVEPAKKMPAWAKAGERWIDINITKQVLVAYEGTTPVYVTLVSSGEHGLADAETTRATKRGIFRIYAKHITTTMDSDVVGEEFELRDVPYVQYFEGGYALHGAFWHDRFGQPKSHGCINLSPEDARRLFFWTEPRVPDGWHGSQRALTGTVVFVHP